MDFTPAKSLHEIWLSIPNCNISEEAWTKKYLKQQKKNQRRNQRRKSNVTSREDAEDLELIDRNGKQTLIGTTHPQHSKYVKPVPPPPSIKKLQRDNKSIIILQNKYGRRINPKFNNNIIVPIESSSSTSQSTSPIHFETEPSPTSSIVSVNSQVPKIPNSHTSTGRNPQNLL
jgi:hypothetical protein